MGAAEVIIWVTVISVFIILFGTIVYLLSRNSTPPEVDKDPDNPQETAPIVPPDPVSFSYSCSQDSECQGNLVCDTFLGECKVDNGQVCKSTFDCLTSSFCSGICLDRSVVPNVVSGQAGVACPCQIGFSCVSSVNNLDRKVCLKQEGIACSQGAECISGVCNTLFEIPICTGPKINGSSCQTNDQCQSSLCSSGYCQDNGVITGTLGSACSPDGSPGCNTDLICSVDRTCVRAANGLLYPCNENVGCPAYFDCYSLPESDKNGKFPAPGTSDGFKLCTPDDPDACVCLYSTDINTALPTPNDQTSTGACIPSQVAVTEGGNKVCKSKFLEEY